MTGHAYLSQLLQSQELRSQELDTVHSIRDGLFQLLSLAFEGVPRIYYGGSYGKNTMIRDAFDLDLVVYFPHTDSRPVRELSGAVHRSLVDAGLTVHPQTVALRLPGQGGFHVDVVPGRAQDATFRYATLYKNTQPPSTLQTSLKVHIDAVRKTELRQIVRLLKLWRIRHGVPLKTFALEILAARALNGVQKSDLAVALMAVLRFISANMENVRLVDPANSNNILDVTADDRSAAARVAERCVGERFWKQIVW
jgi:hypothetical protein